MAFYQIIFSPTGGTAKAARLLAEGFDQPSSTVDLCVSRFVPKDFHQDDICLIAVPAFGGRVPALAARHLSSCRGNGARAILAAVYGNRAFEDTLAELQDLAEAAGFVVIAGVAAVAEHSIAREFGQGRPDEKDAGDLRAMGRTLQERLAQGAERAVLPGNRPYREYRPLPIGIQTGETCNGCGLCAESCPADAIDPAAPSLPPRESCISCMRCTAICPQHARSADPAKVAFLKEKIGPACAERKENQLFIG